MKRPSVTWAHIGFAIAFTAVVLVTLLGVFNGPIKTVIEMRLEAALGHQVTIESLDGNPFYEFSLSRIEVSDSGPSLRFAFFPSRRERISPRILMPRRIFSGGVDPNVSRM